MNRFVALLRGVNVGGKNKLPMASLRESLDKTAFFGVTTYIQSGNIVFNSDLDKAACEALLTRLLKADFNLEVPVIVHKQSYLKEVLQENPFKTQTIAQAKFMSFGFLNTIPTQDNIDAISAFSNDIETFKIVNDVLYFYCGVGFGTTKMTNVWFEKKLGVVSTMRNYNTTTKLMSL